MGADWKRADEERRWNPTETMLRIIEHVKSRGFAVRQNGQYHDYVSATHKQLGVKFSIWQVYRPPYSGGGKVGTYTIGIKPKVKSAHDTWVAPSYDNWLSRERQLQWEVPHDNSKANSPSTQWIGWLKPKEADMSRLLAGMDELKGAAPEVRKDPNKIGLLYEPLKLDAPFIQPDKMVLDTDTGRFEFPSLSVKRLFTNVRVLGFAVINEDLYINDVDTNAPDADVWFHLAAETETSSPHLLVREREDKTFEYYPARKAGKRYRICSNTTPKGTYIDFKRATKLDAMLFEAAILQFLQTL